MDSNQKGQVVTLTNVDYSTLRFTDNLGRNANIDKNQIVSIEAEGDAVYIVVSTGTVYPIYYYTNALGITGTSATELRDNISRVVSQVNTTTRMVVSQNATSAAITGNTNQNIIGSVAIAANTFSATSRAELRAMTTKTGTAGDCTVRVYINTVDSLSGATLIATSGYTSATNLYSQFERQIVFKSATTFTVYSASNSSSLSDRVGTFAPSTITYDTTQQYYLIFTVQLANSGDSVRLNDYELIQKQ